MDMLKMMKEAMAMKARLAEMDRELKGKVIDTEFQGIKIRINAKSEFQEIKLPPEILKLDPEKAERTILSAVQAATKKSQEVMAEEAKKLTGGMKIPGLM